MSATRFCEEEFFTLDRLKRPINHTVFNLIKKHQIEHVFLFNIKCRYKKNSKENTFNFQHVCAKLIGRICL